MSDKPKPGVERGYYVREFGARARVAKGGNISWVKGVAGLPGRPARRQQFAALLERIAEVTSLDEDTRELAKEKTWAMAKDAVKAQGSPGALRCPMLDAKSWFCGAASWIGQALGDILESEAAQKTTGMVTQAGTKAAIVSLLS